MSRAGGGIGTRFGGGETKMEIDRQHIGRRIAKLRRELKTLARTRETKRSRRQSSGIPQAAIAGYTNAGKSTLMNRLTGADVVVADQLFATLDPTVRRLKLPGGRRCTISDTVGFVSKLPHDLVEAFRSTLEEVTLAELIVHVADAASVDLADQVDAVRRVLGEIGAGSIPEVLVLNKIDRLSGSERARVARRYPDSVPVSALSGEGVEGLLETLEATLPHPPVEVELLVPYGREDMIALLYRESEVLSTTHEEAGTIVHARVGFRELAAVRGCVRSERRTG
jgi:GTP-binding protein HflX